MTRSSGGKFTVLVTGATGFVGSALVRELLLRDETHVRATVRRRDDTLGELDAVVVGDIDDRTDWTEALTSVDVVIHLAARAHVLRENDPDPLTAFRRTNVAGALRLAEQAACSGVRRFVYLSSVKVHGESGLCRETDVLAPEDAYGMSKREAEVGLQAVAAHGEMDVVIVRAPLVYGPNVKGNFLSLMNAVASGMPLPLGAVPNRRSLIGIDNLVDALIACVNHPAASNQVFLVSDGEDLSTTALITRLGNAMGRRSMLFPVPVAFLKVGAAVFGQRALANRLLGSLCVDISKARATLGWTPPVNVDDGLKRAARGI